MKNSILLLIAGILIICGCSDNNPVIADPPPPADYIKIYTAESGSNKFEVFSMSSANFVYGYNELGFKYYLDNVEQNQGFVRFKPTMYHGIGGPSHSIPVPDKYFYDNGKSLFTGYAVFIMYDTAAFWAADFSYNDSYSLDSVIIPLIYSNRTKLVAWDNTITEKIYFLTMVLPTAPVVGLNNAEFMFHQTSDMTNYEEINNAEMFIKPWMEIMGHGSSNNADPVYISPARYRGVVNFNMPGEWYLYDSIKVNGNFITPTPAPKFILDVN